MASDSGTSYAPRILELLMRHGIPPQRAKGVAMNELRLWNCDDVGAILQRLNRPFHDYCPLANTAPDPDQSFLRRYFPTIVPSSFAKSPLSLIKDAVRDKKALCVNRACEFKLCDGDYMAVSHVWQEGIRADFQGRGLTRQHINQIFDAISSTGAEWIWLDVLAVPNADPEGFNLTDEEKRLQIEVINTLPQVYSNASAVLVLDALLLQLHPSSALDVAVMLVCGTWLTRVWTYQEIRLAKTALFVTTGTVYSLKDIVTLLDEKVGTRDDNARRLSPYYDLSLSINVLQHVDEIGLSLADIAISSGNRQATYEVDYSRSLFAVLNLTWDAKWTASSEGMHSIYSSYKAHAGRLVAMFGAKRMSVSPRWAPCRLTGLQGRVEGGMTWEDEGLRGTWFKAKMDFADELASATRRSRSMKARITSPWGDVWCAMLIGADEEDRTIQRFKTSVVKGRAYLLCKHAISEGESFNIERKSAGEALVVDAQHGCNDDEVVDVIFVVALTSIVGKSTSEQVSVLLRH